MALTRPSAAQLKSTTVDFSDPLFKINKDQSGTNNKDIGIIFERGSDTNVAFIWDESEDLFALINTTETGSTNGNVSVDSYANIKANAFYGDGTLHSTASETVTTTSETVIYDFLHAVYGSAEFVITAVNGTDRHITKLLVTHNGTTAVATEYGSVFTDTALASYDVSIAGSSTQLLATPTNTSTAFKVVATLIE